MPYNVPTLDGQAIFGLAVKMQHKLKPAVIQRQEFFGVNGVATTFGGKRGRIIEVEGVLIGSDVLSLDLAEGTFETFVDGAAHILIDTRGRQWEDVVYDGAFEVSPDGPRPLVGYFNDDGSQWWALPYRAAFEASV